MNYGMNVEYVDASLIHIRPGRIRDELGDVQELAASILERGLIHPITIDDEHFIIAGFRRFVAVKLLGWTTVPCVRRGNLSDTDRLALEIEENTKRLQFTWQEEAKGKAKLHEMMVQLKGAPTPGSKSSTGWTLNDTAKLLNESVGKVSQDIKLSRYTDHTVVGQRTSRIEALRAVKRTEEIATMTAVADVLKGSGTPDKQPGEFTWGKVRLGDCKFLINELDKESIDLILMDPPYGIAIDKSRWESVSTFHTYKDLEQDDIQRLLNLVFRECWMVLKPGRYLFTFCPVEFVSDWRQLLITTNFNVMPRPLIWYKERGSLTDSFTQFAPAYETFLCAWKGDTRRPFSKPLADVFMYPRPTDRWHKLERAPGVLNDVIETATAPGETVLDPFCGGGSTLAASARLLRRFHGIEIDPLSWGRAVQRLTQLEAGQDDLGESLLSSDRDTQGTSDVPNGAAPGNPTQHLDAASVLADMVDDTQPVRQDRPQGV